MQPLDLVSEALAQRVAAIILDALRHNELVGWIDQSKSPLGRRKHIALARAQGRQIGRRYFLPIEVVEKAMADKALLASLAPQKGCTAPRAGDVDAAMSAPAGE